MTHDDTFARIHRLYEEALDRPLDTREDYVRENAPDTAVADEVLALLAADRRAEDFLETPALGPGIGTEAWIGRRVGPYVLRERIGSGGMGVVFRATQDQPRRDVAIKVVRTTGLSDVSMRRFEMEIEVLGLLDHPGIAQIFDAGSIDLDGARLPWLAMEYVQGRNLTDHARELPIRERLELLATVCDAAHHAHSNGVIHRDLKSANVQVREDGVAKILDFGVARVLDPTSTFQTREGEVVGTLSAMSPEQVRGETRQVDARADVYALGVLGFEMLADRTPHDLKGATLTEAIHRITATDVDFAPLEELPLDVRTILRTCLQRARDDRYDSAADVARDLRRFLADEPILARPPSTLESARRFARHNRGLVGAGVFGLAALVIGLVVSVWGWTSAVEARREADLEAARATRLNEFMHSVLTSADPYRDGADVRVVEVLEAAAASLLEDADTDPRVRSTALSNLGTTYESLGQYAAARPLYERSLEIARSVPDAVSERIHALTNLGDFALAEGEMTTADSLARETEGVLAAHPVIQERVLGADAYHFLGSVAEAHGDFERAASLLGQAIAITVENGGEGTESVSISRNALGNVMRSLGRLEEARDLLRSVHASRVARDGVDHPGTLVTVNNLAFVHKELGEHDEALELFEASYSSRMRVHGASSPTTAIGAHNLALQLAQMGRTDEALARHDEAVRVLEESSGQGGLRRWMARAARGGTLLRMDRLEAARDDLVSSWDVMSSKLGEDHWRCRKVAQDLVVLFERLGDEDAVDLYRARAGT